MTHTATSSSEVGENESNETVPTNPATMAVVEDLIQRPRPVGAPTTPYKYAWINASAVHSIEREETEPCSTLSDFRTHIPQLGCLYSSFLNGDDIDSRTYFLSLLNLLFARSRTLRSNFDIRTSRTRIVL